MERPPDYPGLGHSIGSLVVFQQPMWHPAGTPSLFRPTCRNRPPFAPHQDGRLTGAQSCKLPGLQHQTAFAQNVATRKALGLRPCWQLPAPVSTPLQATSSYDAISASCQGNGKPRGFIKGLSEIHARLYCPCGSQKLSLQPQTHKPQRLGKCSHPN